MRLDWPGPTQFDGNATNRLYIDDAADTNQHKELEDILQGKRGGPMQMLSQLVAKWLPTMTTRIDIKEDNDGHNITARVGKFGEIKGTAIEESSKSRHDSTGSRFCLSVSV